MSNDHIGEFLGIENDIIDDDDNRKVIIRTESSNEISTNLLDNIEKTRVEEAEIDHDYVRKNMYDIIEKGTGALTTLIEVATASQEPRAFEVVAQTLKTLVDANKELTVMSNKKASTLSAIRDEHSIKSNVGTDNSVTNNLFVGTTHDLMLALKAMKK